MTTPPSQPKPPADASDAPVERVTGTVESSLYRSEETGYTVCNVKPSGRDVATVTVVGNTAGRHPTINSLRLNVQSSRHFRHGDYRAPRGYQARHWTYGDRLPRAYFVRDYWILDFLMFGLFEPPPDLIWVRVGNDALLVDRYSGDIVQVDYDVFY